MPMTIAENICTVSDYDRKKLFAAFDKAGISEKINSLPLKEKTYMIKDVYKDAADFSGGEKQKLLLAKAIYKNAPVLILDEPTAALDPIAENELYLKYNEMTNGKIFVFYFAPPLVDALLRQDFCLLRTGKLPRVVRMRS